MIMRCRCSFCGCTLPSRLQVHRRCEGGVMASDRFDEIAREIGAGTTRRRALRLLVGTLTGGLLGLLGTQRVKADIDCRPAGKTCRGKGIPLFTRVSFRDLS